MQLFHFLKFSIYSCSYDFPYGKQRKESNTSLPKKLFSLDTTLREEHKWNVTKSKTECLSTIFDMPQGLMIVTKSVYVK